MKTLLSETSANFLLHASLLFKETCPELSRFYLQGSVKANTKASVKKKSTCPLQSTSVCSHCYQWLQPDNHRVRLRPKQRPSARVWSVLRRHAKGKHLSLAQKHLLRRFQKSSSVLMATCNTCNKTSRHKGMNRDFIATIAKTHSTPGSASKHRTPQSTSRSNMTTPKTASKDKTPAHTPRSSTSSNASGSGSSASKPPSKSKNWVVQRLSKILLREDSKSSKKGGLKDFLSSL
ncbi:UPF0711 protein C18orf21 homolog [Hippoglossus hippoglossus]|uniref:UPF0711 protein C18orf21 homolog n=1 Tax=Hippoglossus hippoglossus TaxID=8267 RepID=UPI00148D5A96|nr:UPF0711 protein C18orf21 homolog [Hippoglossus hippoglossus]XP_035039179.1 UPF0711 protein C18orf21 homolog [Hippoglossus stenolepis]